MPNYSLAELAQLADVTPRTIRFYVAQGLLPSPEAAGPRTTYTDEHLERLLLIKKLQSAGLPLATIRAQLRTGTTDEPSRVAESAVDYIRGVLGTGPAPAAPAARSVQASRSVPPPAAPATQQPPTQYDLQSPEPDRSQWDRVGITPDIEIHIRRPASRIDQKRVYRLIEFARQLFREET